MVLAKYPKVLELSKVEGEKGFKFIGQNLHRLFLSTPDQSGASVSHLGDINGDGWGDFIIGAPGAIPPSGSTGAGQSYVIFGNSNVSESTISLSDLDGNNGFILNGGANGDAAGYSVSATGDFNGDGVNDIIIGAPGSTNLATGQCYIVFGKRGPTSSMLSLSSLDGNNGFMLTSAGGARNGFSVNSAGDLNGDGVSDIIIGAPGSTQLVPAGQSYVVFGKSVWGSTFSLSSLDGSNGFSLSGITAGDNSGISVSNAGDVNGDGISDIIIGAPIAYQAAGQTYIVFGNRGLWSSTFLLSGLDGSNGFVLNGITAGDYSGWSVSGTGDVNGDGISDIIIGAPNALNRAGQSYVIFGKQGTWSSPFSLSNLDGSNGFVLNGVTAGDQSGWSVGNAGDVNGDGISDIIIGAPSFNGNQPGQSYVVFGKYSTWSSNFSLASLDGSNGFVLNGVTAGDDVGYSVSSAGDINGDGISDILVGAPGASPNGLAGAGTTYIITNATNLPPWFVNTIHLSIAQGQIQSFSPQNIQASDDWTLDENLQFIINALYAGEFRSAAIPTLTFSQGDVIAGRVFFVHDGSSNAPNFKVTVSDGILATGPQSAMIDFTPTPTNTNNNTASVIGGAAGAILGSAALIGVGALYLRNQADKRLEKAIKENGNGIEQESTTKNKILYPIVKKVYEQIKISGCLGHLTPETASAFVNAMQALVDEFQKLRMDLDLEKMPSENQSQLLKEIVRHIRIHTGTSASCNRFFKAEVTPIQIQDKAHAIAEGVHAIMHSTQSKTEAIELEENTTPYTKLL